MEKKEFWIRLSVWMIFAVISPCVFIGWRYGIFTQKSGLTGGGILVVIIISIFLLSVIKNVKQGLPKFSMAVQCINGVLTLLPLISIAVILKLIENNIAAFEQTLIVIIMCEAVAIPIDPFPKWKEVNHIELETNIFKNVLGMLPSREKKDK